MGRNKKIDDKPTLRNNLRKSPKKIWFIHNPLAKHNLEGFRIREGTFMKDNNDGRTCKVIYTYTVTHPTENYPVTQTGKKSVDIEYNHIAPWNERNEIPNELKLRMQEAKRIF